MIENSQRENLQSQPEEVDADSVKCLGCGSNMVFNPEKQTLTCPHCGSKQDFSTDVFASELSLVDGLVQETVGVMINRLFSSAITVRQGSF